MKKKIHVRLIAADNEYDSNPRLFVKSRKETDNPIISDMGLFHDIMEHTYKSKKYESHILGEVMAFGAIAYTRQNMNDNRFVMQVSREKYGHNTLYEFIDNAKEMRYQGRDDTDFDFEKFPRIHWQRYCNNRQRHSTGKCYCAEHDWYLSRLINELHKALFSPDCIDRLGREFDHDAFEDDTQDWIVRTVENMRKHWNKIEQAILFGYHQAENLYRESDLDVIYEGMKKLHVDKEEYFEGQEFRLTVNLESCKVTMHDLSPYSDQDYY